MDDTKSFIKRKMVFLVVLAIVVFVATIIYYLYPSSYCSSDKFESIVFNDEDYLKITYFGNLAFDGSESFLFDTPNEGIDYSNYFEFLKDYFGDYNIATLKGGITLDNESMYQAYEYPNSLVDTLEDNIDLVNISAPYLSKNYNMKHDKNDDLFISTVTSLTKNKIDYIGLSSKEGLVPCFDIEGTKVAILSYGDSSIKGEHVYSSPTIDLGKMKSEITEVKKIADVVFVILSFDEEENEVLRTFREKFYSKKSAKFGSDVTIINDSKKIMDKSNLCFETHFMVNNKPKYVLYSGNLSQIGNLYNFYINKNSKELKYISIVPTYFDFNKTNRPGTAFNCGADTYGLEILNSLIKDASKNNIPFVEEYFLNLNEKTNKISLAYRTYSKEISIKDTYLEKIFKDGNTICILGDSLSNENCSVLGSCAWYKAIDFKNPIVSFAKDGATSKELLDLVRLEENKDILSYNNYIIAIGENDANKSVSVEEYIENVDNLTSLLGKEGNFIILGSFSGNKEYDNALKEYCESKNITYVDMASSISQTINDENRYYYFIDDIHPNSKYGIKLLGEIFLENLPK